MTTGFGSINLSFLKSAAGWAFSAAILILSILMLRDPTADQTTAIVTLIMAGIYFVIFSLRIHGHFRPARQASTTPRDYSVRFDDQCISIENRNG